MVTAISLLSLLGKPPDIKPYAPPRMDPEPEVAPADTAVLAAPDDGELAIVARPAAGMPLVGTAAAGARLAVRGMYEATTDRGCARRRWYAIAPQGWVCAGWVQVTEDPPTTEPALKVAEGRTLPFRYVMALPREGDKVPLWASPEDMERQAAPVAELKKGDTVAVRAEPLRFDGESYLVAEDGRVLPAKGPVTRMGEGSGWTGVVPDEQSPLPFGWVTTPGAPVYDGPDRAARVMDRAGQRDRLPLLDEAGQGAARRVRVGDGRWLRASDVNEVRALPRPAGTQGHARWIDVDLGEQVLVAYEGDRPVYATLVATGRSVPTPRGDYPIWGKVPFITMKSQPYEDQTYYVDRVPWVMFFQGHNAIHGAYWHDRFGTTKSHGCVNVAPRDARWLFEWVPPALPPGWSGTRAPNLLEAVTVHVRNSHLRNPFAQERPIGPPDRAEEKARREAADARRAEAATLSGP
jgi:hypothetical protein